MNYLLSNLFGTEVYCYNSLLAFAASHVVTGFFGHKKDPPHISEESL